MPTVSDLSAAQVRRAVNQIVTASTFRTHNAHLTQAQFAGLMQQPRQWPLEPVFHPYAPSHDGYGQGKNLPPPKFIRAGANNVK